MMQCREGCGACCIAPAITTPFYGMPRGKAAGERCVHLDYALRCELFGDPRRPICCAQFEAEPDLCGSNREDALHRLTQLEAITVPLDAPTRGRL